MNTVVSGSSSPIAALFFKDGRLMRLLRAAVPPAWRQPHRSAILMQFEDDSRWLGVKLGVLVLLVVLAMVRIGLL
jgi:hypothetical protein